MRYSIIFFLLSVVFSSFGQTIESHDIKIGKSLLSFTTLAPETSPKKTFIVFGSSSAEVLDQQNMLTELSSFSALEQALLVTIKDAKGELSASDWGIALNTLSPNCDLNCANFIAFGDGIHLSNALIEAGVSGCIVAPSDTLKAKYVSPTSVYAVIDVHADDRATEVLDYLSREGAWVLPTMVLGESAWTFDRRNEVLAEMSRRLDSLKAYVAADTAISSQVNELRTKVPEVLREGDVIEVEIQVYQHGNFRLSVEALSGAVIRSEEVFAGKGLLKSRFKTDGMDWGVYKLVIDGPGMIEKYKFMIKG